jgi:hypothetical protein
MNTRKPIAIVAAMLITAAGMTGIANYSNAAAEVVHRAGNASAQTLPVTLLPTIEVKPTPEQLRQLRDEGALGGAAAIRNDARMPYYSFAADAAGT